MKKLYIGAWEEGMGHIWTSKEEIEAYAKLCNASKDNPLFVWEVSSRKNFKITIPDKVDWKELT